jgi:Pyridoxamine 5'-phosphate oxidase
VAKVYEEIDDRLRRWISRQRLFFVGSAPRTGGHVNVSPKGPIDTLAVLGGREVAYLDLVGSGAETVAHLRDDGRLCVMLCAFEGPPRIVRLHGSAEPVLADDPRFGALAARAGLDVERFAGLGLQRSIVRMDVDRVSDSCGFGVPLLEYRDDRPHMAAWADRKRAKGGAEALRDYQRANNAESIDGLPAVQLPPP